MIVKITLTAAGSSTSLFDIYSDSDSFTTPIVSNVPKVILTSGNEFFVPDDATSVRVQSLADCVNYIDIPLT